MDAQHGLGDAEQDIVARLPAGIARLNVHNKIDLAGEAPRVVATGDAAEVWLSAKTGQGVELLRGELLRLAGWQPAGESGFMARARHLAALNRARGRLQEAAEPGKQLELQAEELRLAQEALSEITGEFTPDVLLGEIFSRFCIGK
jgi:tRNA modification GTPase